MKEFFRGRRLRGSAVIRDLVRENELRPQDLVMPYFVLETPQKGVCKSISSMPGQFQMSVDELEKQVERAVEHGLKSCLLFGIPARKDDLGSGAYAEDGIVQKAAYLLKKRHGKNLVVIADTCLCEYTAHGHCGLLDSEGEVQNDLTLELLARASVSQAKAGADVIAPSDMMDGRVLAIREALDLAGFSHVPIMSYAVKYASSFYGPFREAVQSAPKSGDRKSYQMDPANSREAMREAAADVLEGADILMVKPAGPYLDIIRLLRDSFYKPLAAYQVSGEYSTLRAAGANGWIDEDAAVLEALVGMKRAGADIVITYFAQMLLEKGLV